MSLPVPVTLAALGAMWGSSFLFMRVAVPSMGAPALVEGRVLIAALAITVVGWWTGQRFPRGAEWRPCIMIGAFYTALPLVLWAWAAHTTHASLLSIINATAPLFGAVVSVLWFREKLTMPGVLGLLLGFAGVTVLVGGEGVDARANAPALAAAFGAAILYGVMANYTGSVQRTHHTVTPWTQAIGSMWVAVVLTAPLVVVFPFNHTPPPSAWAAVAALGLLSTGLAYVMYFRLLAREGAATGLTATYLIPLFGTLWGALFLDERIGLHSVAGGVMIVAGIALVARSRAHSIGKATS